MDIAQIKDIAKITEVSKFNWPPESQGGRETWRHIIDYKIVDAKGCKLNILEDSIDKYDSPIFLIGKLLGCPSFKGPTVSPLVRIRIKQTRKYSIDYGRSSRDSNRGLWILGSKSKDSTCWYKLETPDGDYKETHCSMQKKTALFLMLNDAIDSFEPDKRNQPLYNYVKGHERETELFGFISDCEPFIKENLAGKLGSVDPAFEEDFSGCAEDGEEEDDDPTKCSVCLSPRAFDHNKIIFCDGSCGSCVHMSCYGLQVHVFCVLAGYICVIFADLSC